MQTPQEQQQNTSNLWILGDPGKLMRQKNDDVISPTDPQELQLWSTKRVVAIAKGFTGLTRFGAAYGAISGSLWLYLVGAATTPQIIILSLLLSGTGITTVFYRFAPRFRGEIISRGMPVIVGLFLLATSWNVYQQNNESPDTSPQEDIDIESVG